MKRLLAATRLYYSQALAVEMVYRYALFQSFIGYAVAFLGLCLFWLAASKNGTAATGYTPATLIAYFIFATIHSLLHENRLGFVLSSAIRMGKLSASLLRPYPFIWSILSQTAAQVTIRAVLLVPIVIASFMLVPVLRPVLAHITAEQVGIYLLALALSMIAGWSIKLVVGLLAFDMTQTWGPELIFLAIYAAASGGNYPVDLLPPALMAIVSWTPVYYMVGFPALLLLGRIETAAAWTALGQGAVVVIITQLIVYLMWRRGIKSFEAIGI